MESTSIPLKKLKEKFFSLKEERQKAGTRAWYEYMLRCLDPLETRENLDSITTADLAELAKTRGQIQAVKAFFEWLHEWAEAIPKNPAKRLKQPRGKRRKRIFQRGELAKWLRASKPEFRYLLLAARETVSRPQEVRQFRWEQIRGPLGWNVQAKELEEGKCYFELSEWKAHDRERRYRATRWIPISKRLGRLLASLRHRRTDRREEIFRDSHGNPWTKNAVCKRFMRMRKKFPGGEGPHSEEHLVCGTLRHTSATHLANAGVSPKILAEIMGHTELTTTQIYFHAEIEPMLEAINTKPKK